MCLESYALKDNFYQVRGVEDCCKHVTELADELEEFVSASVTKILQITVLHGVSSFRRVPILAKSTC